MKKHVTVTLDDDVIEKARKLNVNLSGRVNDLLRAELKIVDIEGIKEEEKETLKHLKEVRARLNYAVDTKKTTEDKDVAEAEAEKARKRAALTEKLRRLGLVIARGRTSSGDPYLPDALARMKEKMVALEEELKEVI